MKSSSSLIFGFLGILILVVFASGCTSSSNTYNANGISFNYPSNWTELSPDKVTFASGGNSTVIAAVADPNTIQNKNYQTLVLVQSINSTVSLSDAVTAFKNLIQSSGGQIVSEKSITVDGISSTELVYTISVTGVAKKERLVIVPKNNKIYTITGSATSTDFNGQQSNFDLIINSFKIQ